MKYNFDDIFHIFMNESTSPELVGWRPAPHHFDSSKFFKEDLPTSLPPEGLGFESLIISCMASLPNRPFQYMSMIPHIAIAGARLLNDGNFY